MIASNDSAKPQAAKEEAFRGRKRRRRLRTSFGRGRSTEADHRLLKARGVRRTRPSCVLSRRGSAGVERARDEWMTRKPARRNAVQMAKSFRRSPSLEWPPLLAAA